nr:hypothetical protein [Tanacetum cinerariifolium]
RRKSHALPSLSHGAADRRIVDRFDARFCRTDPRQSLGQGHSRLSSGSPVCSRAVLQYRVGHRSGEQQTAWGDQPRRSAAG